MGRSQVLYNQRKGRGRGRGSGSNPGRVASDARKRISRPKWNGGKDGDENNEEKDADNYNYENAEERLENEVSLLDANVSSQRYVVSSKNVDSEAVTFALNLFQPDSGKFMQEMNFALKHLSLEDRFRIPSRLISTITGDEPDTDIQDESTVMSALSSVTEKRRVANVLADPVASRLGIQNLPSKPIKISPRSEPSPRKSGRVSLLGVTTSLGTETANQRSKVTTILATQESQEKESPEKIFDESGSLDASVQANQEDEDSAVDLVMRLRSLPSQDHEEIPLVATNSTNEEDIDEWLKDTLNSKDESSNVKVASKEMEDETLDEEHLEDWLDSMI